MTVPLEITEKLTSFVNEIPSLSSSRNSDKTQMQRKDMHALKLDALNLKGLISEIDLSS